MLEWSKFDHSVPVMETAIEDIHGVDIEYMFLSLLPPDSNSLNFETTYPNRVNELFLEIGRCFCQKAKSPRNISGHIGNHIYFAIHVLKLTPVRSVWIQVLCPKSNVAPEIRPPQ